MTNKKQLIILTLSALLTVGSTACSNRQASFTKSNKSNEETKQTSAPALTKEQLEEKIATEQVIEEIYALELQNQKAHELKSTDEARLKELREYVETIVSFASDDHKELLAQVLSYLNNSEIENFYELQRNAATPHEANLAYLGFSKSKSLDFAYRMFRSDSVKEARSPEGKSAEYAISENMPKIYSEYVQILAKINEEKAQKAAIAKTEADHAAAEKDKKEEATAKDEEVISLSTDEESEAKVTKPEASEQKSVTTTKPEDIKPVAPAQPKVDEAKPAIDEIKPSSEDVQKQIQDSMDNFGWTKF